MFDQIFEGVRKASESSMLAQQELLKQWVKQWPTASTSAASSVIDKNSALQKRWIDAVAESMHRQRELLDTTCRAGVQLIEQSAKISEAKSPDDYRRLLEEQWRKLFDVLKHQSEGQLQEMKKTSEAWLDAAQGPIKASAG